MNRKNTKYLHEKFRWYNPPKENGMWLPIHINIACHDGWFKLIKELSENIQKELTKLDINLKKDFYVEQIKEKFGGLRFYVNFIPSNKISELIKIAEEKSYTICEDCGKKGKLRGDLPWVLTLCDECYSRRLSKYDYPMPKWAKKQIIRESGLVENICKHGVGHPHLKSAKEIAKKYKHPINTWIRHGCCQDECCGMS